MSLHNHPDYQIPELIADLKTHRLTHYKPSQLSDGFRIGWKAGYKHGAWAASVPTAPRPPSITLDFKQATELLGMYGGEPTEITLMTGEGHSGKGVYAHWTAVPDEGAMFLGVSDEEAAPEEKPAANLCDLDALAREFADSYASPHHFTMSVAGLRNIVRAAAIKEVTTPMQPIVWAADGMIRFKENRIVNAILEESRKVGYDLNVVARGDFTQEERMQFAQLIGYSVSGYGTLSYASPESVEKADAIADEMSTARTLMEEGK